MRIKVLDQLTVIFLDVFAWADSNSQHEHVVWVYDLVEAGMNLLHQFVIEKLVSNCNLLALEESLQKVMETGIFERRLEGRYLVFHFLLKLAKKGLSLAATLRPPPLAKQATKD